MIIPCSLGLDLGGTLLKVSLASSSELLSLPAPLSFHSHLTFHYFMHFSSQEAGLRQLALTLRDNGIEPLKIGVTGGGAFKYESILKQLFGKVEVISEFDSLFSGYKYLSQFNPRSIIIDSPAECSQRQIFPFLLANIGSGVSFLKLQSSMPIERVGGTCLGGGYFLGLARLINGPKSFQQIITQAATGSNQQIDLLIQDVYRDEAVPQQLQGATLLVSMGKLQNKSKVAVNDLNKSILYMVSFNIALHAFLQLKLHSLKNVVFTGFFMRDNDVTRFCIQKALKFFALKHKYQVNCIFVQHDGYIGSIGALSSILK